MARSACAVHEQVFQSRGHAVKQAVASASNFDALERGVGGEVRGTERSQLFGNWVCCGNGQMGQQILFAKDLATLLCQSACVGEYFFSCLG